MLLHAYADRKGFASLWFSSAKWEIITTIVLWLVAVLERGRVSQISRVSDKGVLHAGLFALISFILLGLTFTIMHICNAMLLMIDTYCWDIAGNRDLSEAVRSWNVLQAILRKASGTIEHCFFTLQTTAFAVVLLGVTDMIRSLSVDHKYIPTLVPSVVVVLGIVRIFRASAVTSRCTHVPSLINSLSFGDEIDRERQYVVEYIINSSAGFHVYEVRLTSSLALKVAYVSAAAAFTFATSTMPKS
mmetsp:Transcript_18462/g.50696  ORF Transcript_18462/g.50696 Transcript_18462/m.50696 type:complete len:245 (-) Transcript_18462:235-969(-)